MYHIEIIRNSLSKLRLCYNYLFIFLMTFVCSAFPEITCPTPTLTPPNTTITSITLETTYPLHHIIFYQCIRGTWLPDKSYSQSSSCIEPGMWSPEPIACEGRLIMVVVEITLLGFQPSLDIFHVNLFMSSKFIYLIIVIVFYLKRSFALRHHQHSIKILCYSVSYY